MICLLCPAIAVADCLCVPCGAMVWAAKEWEERPYNANQMTRFDLRKSLDPAVAERVKALQAMRSGSAR